MKKTNLLLLITIGICTSFVSADAKKVLLDHLDLRIKANEEYNHQYLEDARESELAERIVPVEMKNNQAWIEYLEFLKKKADFEVIARVLRVEILGELSSSLYDLEYAGNKIEKVAAETKINKWNRQLTEVENAMKELGIKITPPGEKK